MSKRKSIFNLTFNELSAELDQLGLKSFRSKQVWQGLYQQFWTDVEQFTNLSKDLRKKLGEKYAFFGLDPIIRQKSKLDKTEKLLFQLEDGQTIEAVLMRYRDRNTICISTQVGCAMDCAFCATGQMGFHRNLTTAEIVQQVLYFARELAEEGKKLTNVVIMGMGEPFLNYDAVMKAIDILNDENGFCFSQRRFTISTVGVIPMIEAFTREKSQVNLAISLHSVNNKVRSRLLPINKKYGVHELVDACRDYVNQTHRRISFEWALINGINDHVDDAKELARLLHGLNCHVNLITLNETKNYAGKGSSQERAEAFKAVLDVQNIPCTIRLRRGLDINAGCGQLASKQKEGMI